jgi:phosphate transport system substrate-binding protein
VTRLQLFLAGLIFVPLLAAAGCGPASKEIKIDGSSTVLLISEAAATVYMDHHPEINITVGSSGTGGGFKKFAAGELDISDASRSIKDKEMAACKANGIEYIPLQVAWDGLSVIIHKDNTWARTMTVEQLKKIWHPNTDNFKNANKWNEVDPSWPNEEIKLFGAGTDSGTFDYFTEAINGKEKRCRQDYLSTEDDNSIILGVTQNKYAMGFLGYAYYQVHETKLHAVAVVARKGADAIGPSTETILTGSYKPLSRPLFIYVRTNSLREPHVRDFVEFYLRRTDLVSQAGYVPLAPHQQWEQRQELHKVTRFGMTR